MPLLQLSLLCSLKVQWAAGIVSGSLRPCYAKDTPTRQFFPRDIPHWQHKWQTQCYQLLRAATSDVQRPQWGFMHTPIRHGNPRFCPMFHTQLSVSQRTSQGLGLDSGCLQHPCALPKAKLVVGTEVPLSVSGSSTRRGYVEPAEKQGHGEILCGRNYYEKQEEKKKGIGGQESLLSLFQCFPYFPPTLITSVSPYLSLITSNCPQGIINR